jgi:hypothetical protein
MAKTRPLLLYSVNTSLAFDLNEHYYGGKHWVWCNPFFDSQAARAAGYTAPPSSIPIEIYRCCARAVDNRDSHSDAVRQNRTGLARGAQAQHAAGTITASQLADILAIVRQADLADFAPLIYIIPYARVSRQVVAVTPLAAANPFSAEFQIASLARRNFHTIRP